MTSEQVGAGRVDRDAAQNERLDEDRFLRGDHEIRREGQVSSHPRRRALDDSDHWLVAVQDGSDQLLGTGHDSPADLPDNRLGVCSEEARDVRTGTEVPPRGTQDDAPHGSGLVCALK